MLMIYGANGFSGELIAREAKARGLEVVLAGRNGVSVAALAVELGFAHRVFGLENAGELRQGLEGVRAVLHCAGPFSRTSAPMVEACLELGIHYLDITGEIAVFEAVFAHHERAKARGAALLPGVGFDVVPTDCLAAKLHAALPDATHLDLAFVNVGGGTSRGTRATMIEGLGELGAVRRDGKIVPVPQAFETLEIDFPAGRRTVMTTPWGDVSTAYHSTGIPNIRIFTGVHPKTVRRLRRMRPLRPLLGLAWVRRFLLARSRSAPAGPSEHQRTKAKIHLWGRVRNAQGEEITAIATVPEGYTFTASAAVESLRRVAAGEVPPGAWTPSKAFGADFLASFPGVEVGELVRS